MLYGSWALGRGLLACCALAALLAACGPASVAHADGYRYWSYWHGSGETWEYATKGPGTHRPDDGQVDGWRFTTGAEGRASKPRRMPDFERICAGIRIRDGYKRVGLVIDYGTADDAPAGAEPPRQKAVTKCVVAAEDATSIDVLNRAARTRSGSSGLLCSIDGYPAKGCGGSTSDPSTPASSSASPEGDAGSSGTGDGSSTAVAVVAGVVIGAVVIAAMYIRRRGSGG